eukprot:scaffold2117_cov241-Pinguiococcus_pyrenoidosus.AAC.21
MRSTSFEVSQLPTFLHFPRRRGGACSLAAKRRHRLDGIQDVQIPNLDDRVERPDGHVRAGGGVGALSGSQTQPDEAQRERGNGDVVVHVQVRLVRVIHVDLQHAVVFLRIRRHQETVRGPDLLVFSLFALQVSHLHGEAVLVHHHLLRLIVHCAHYKAFPRLLLLLLGHGVLVIVVRVHAKPGRQSKLVDGLAIVSVGRRLRGRRRLERPQLHQLVR